MSKTIRTAAAPTKDYVASIRRYLRITTSALDGEITDLISAARDDLALGGVLTDRVENESDALIKHAVAVFVKAGFGLDNADADKYREAYTDLKKRLMNADQYIKEA